MQTPAMGSGPELLRAEPHPLLWTCLMIWGLMNHRIGLWVVLLMTQSTCREMHPEVFASFSMMSLWLAAATSRAPSTMQAGRLPRQVPGTGCFDPAPGSARCEFSSAQRWIHQATQRRGSVQLPAAANTSKGISPWH